MFFIVFREGEGPLEGWSCEVTEASSAEEAVRSHVLNPDGEMDGSAGIYGVYEVSSRASFFRISQIGSKPVVKPVAKLGK
jgi:hypothetical protein